MGCCWNGRPFLIRVSHVLTSVRDGGLEGVVRELSIGLSPRGIESEVCALLDDNPGRDRFETAGVPLRSFGARNRGGLGGVLPNMAAMLRLAVHFRRTRPDVIVVHDFFPGVLGRVAALFARKSRVVATLHATYDWLGPRAGKINHLLGRWTDMVVAVSEAAKAASMARDRIDSGRYQVVTNGVDLDCYSPRSTAGLDIRHQMNWDLTDVLVGCVGVIRASKRQVDLIRAMRPIMRGNPGLKLVLVGTPRIHEEAYRVALEAELATLPPNAWTILQDLRDLSGIYNQFEIVALPSESEGFGLALAEALASGRACAAAGIDAHREVAGSCALYHPPGDLDALEANLRRLLGDPILRARLGNDGRSWVESEFSRGKMLDGWQRIFKQLSEGYDGS